jgi:hypothetical protein
MSTAPVRLRYIVIPQGQRWAILDAETGTTLAKTYGERQLISAQAAAYRYNRDRCQNCLDAIIRHETHREDHDAHDDDFDNYRETAFREA